MCFYLRQNKLFFFISDYDAVKWWWWGGGGTCVAIISQVKWDNDTSWHTTRLTIICRKFRKWTSTRSASAWCHCENSAIWWTKGRSSFKGWLPLRLSKVRELMLRWVKRGKEVYRHDNHHYRRLPPPPSPSHHHHLHQRVVFTYFIVSRSAELNRFLSGTGSKKTF